MPATYEPIATYTCPDATQRTITFNSIPNTYTDLRVVAVARTEVAGTGPYSFLSVRFNSNSSSVYSYLELTGSGSAAQTSQNVDWTYAPMGYLNYVSSPNTVSTLDIFNYAGSNFKTGLYTCARDLNGSGTVHRGVIIFRSTSAISSLSLDTDGFGVQTGRDFMTGSTFTLYGIKAA